MTSRTIVHSTSLPFESTKTRIRDTLLAGFGVFVPVVVIATIAVHTVPHVRGIGFVPQLRYAVVTPACLIAAVGIAVLYQFIKERADRPRRELGVLLSVLALVVVMIIAIAGPRGLAGAAAPAVLAVAIALAALVPRFVERPRRRRLGIVATVVFGALEIAGVFAALASERVMARGSGDVAFDIPRAIFDADHKFVDLPNGARIHYIDEGTGETPATRKSIAMPARAVAPVSIQIQPQAVVHNAIVFGKSNRDVDKWSMGHGANVAVLGRQPRLQEVLVEHSTVVLLPRHSGREQSKQLVGA